MEGMILIAVLFLTATILFLGIVFCYLASKLLDIDLPFGRKVIDKTTPLGEDLFSKPDRIPVDQFLPRTDMPLKVKYSDKDIVTKQ